MVGSEGKLMMVAMRKWNFTYLLLTAIAAAVGGCAQKMPEDAGVHEYDTFYIPQYASPEPNQATLQFYLKKVLRDADGFGKLSIDGSATPRKLSFDGKENQFLQSQMESTGLISYLFYDEGEVIYDELSSKERFGRFVNDRTPLWTHSIGKSWTSYLLGHAICEGYIDSVTTDMNDWALMQDTLYEEQPLLNLINMRAGDQLVVTESDGLVSSGRWFNVHPLSAFSAVELANTQAATRVYNYNGLVTNIVLNYIFFKTGDETADFLNMVFRDHVGIADDIFFLTQPDIPMEYGPVRYSARASRYDFLRVGLAMLDDWNNDSCIRSYFQTILAESQYKGFRNRKHPHKNESALRYGGFFHTHYVGMRNRNILGMDGYGGQAQLIDLDSERIVSVNTIHTNYDWGELVYRAIRDGDIQKE
jgi:hypothetical protein